jgi:cation:H+ antiporter
MLVNDKILSINEGIILFMALIGFIIILIRSSTEGNADENIDDDLEVASYFKIGVWLIIGSVALYYGSEWLVDGAKTIALDFGVSEGTIGISLIAIGTSIPELAASIIAALKQEKALSLGNLIGSNIFNIGSVLGLTAIINPIAVNEPQILSNDIFWMLGFAAVILLLVLLPQRYQISRPKGFLLVLLYCVFMGFVFME